MKTSELEGAALDWAVAKCEGYIDDSKSWMYQAKSTDLKRTTWHPQKHWAQGGPIIEREQIGLEKWKSVSGWQAFNPSATLVYNGKTPLIAAMRCYVASKLGEEVDVPDELGESR